MSDFDIKCVLLSLRLGSQISGVLSYCWTFFEYNVAKMSQSGVPDVVGLSSMQHLDIEGHRLLHQRVDGGLCNRLPGPVRN